MQAPLTVDGARSRDLARALPVRSHLKSGVDDLPTRSAELPPIVAWGQLYLQTAASTRVTWVDALWYLTPMARTNLLSAALRHVRDAETLIRPGPDRSIDQVLYLSGLGPECARKACVDNGVADKALGHDIHSEEDDVLAVLLSLDPSASRYQLAQHSSELPHRHRLWRIERRYDKTGATTESEARAVLEEARRFVDRWTIELWSDGVIDAEELQ